jgi:hypothetical protein
MVAKFVDLCWFKWYRTSTQVYTIDLALRSPVLKQGELKMTNLPAVLRKTILFAGLLVSLLAVMALSVSIKTHSQPPQVLSQNNKDALLKLVESSPGQPLKVAGNTDCPLRIIQANVKEVSGPDFSKLTGRTTDLVTVSSVPEVTLLNASGKTITGFIVAIRDPQSRTTRVFVQQKLAILAGATYGIKHEDFVDPERVTVAGSDGGFRQARIQPKLDSEKYWLQFAGRSDLFITVGRVSFDDGSSWKIKEGGEVK